ncbi:MAG: SDR family oxidoreductase [Myxococcota bacterium]|nr:SDR family oxidoreductase [Myxococcota bacterium]
MSDTVARVLVTGGGTGIGLAIVKALLARQKAVVAVGRRVEKLADAAALGAETVPWDITENAAGLFARIGPVDGLVHNAGMCKRAGIDQWSEADWSAMWRVNVMAPALLSQAFVRQLDGPGSIVAISSTLAERPAPGTAGYGATKAALVNLVKHMALELAPRQIRVNAVLPGVVPTEMTQSSADPEHSLPASVVALHPLGRLGHGADVADAVCYALDAPWMTGSAVTIDGGLLSRE